MGSIRTELTWSVLHHFSAPAEDAIEYEVRTTLDGFTQKSDYQGWPDSDKDQRWEQLYKDGVVLHVGPEVAERLPFKTEHVPSPGLEGEYVIGLDVFHQLHCLVSDLV